MSRAILIIGKSGSGKSTSIRNLNSEETFLINVLGKDLPFKGSYKPYIKGEGGNTLIVSEADKIVSVLNSVSEKMPHIKNIVIDDMQYILLMEMMARVKEKGLN